MEEPKLVCPSCHKTLNGLRRPGIFKCKPCGSVFYVPPIMRPE